MLGAQLGLLCGAGKDHQPGANDSLIYNSLFGRMMGNTVRMRPRDAEGRGRGDDVAAQHSTADQRAAAWNNVWETEKHLGATEMSDRGAKVSIKVTVSPAMLSSDQLPNLSSSDLSKDNKHNLGYPSIFIPQVTDNASVNYVCVLAAWLERREGICSLCLSGMML